VGGRSRCAREWRGREIIDLRSIWPLDLDTIVNFGEEDAPLRRRA